MGSQSATAIFSALPLALAGACGPPAKAPVSSISTPVDAPDLSLTFVAFARLSEGRVVARGNARQLDYRRPGGRLQASEAGATIHPEPGTRLADLGTLHFTAPALEGEVQNRRGTATGGVQLDTSRGDRANSPYVAYDADVVHTDAPVDARGPGYRVSSRGLVASADGSQIRLVNGVRGQLQMEAQR